MSRPESGLAHLFRALKAPAAARALPKLADRARSEEWSYEHFAATLLKPETDSRDSHGGQARIKAARFPARKTLEEFDFAFSDLDPPRQRPAPRPARLPRRPRERRPARPARSWFTVHLSAQGVISRSMVGAGTLMASPLRRSRGAWVGGRLPRLAFWHTGWPG